MPLNESKGYRRGGLTNEQKRQAEAAIYGLPQEVYMNQLSHQEIERMRAILQAHDQQSGGSMKEFDINNPPRVPYSYQEFPRTMYNHAKLTTQTAQSHEDMELALSQGWSKEPFAADAYDGPELDAASAAEAARLDSQLVKRARR